MSPQTGAVSGLRPVSLGAVNWAVFPGTQAIRTRHLHPDLRRAPRSLSWCETPVPAVTAQKAGRTAPVHAPSRGSAQTALGDPRQETRRPTGQGRVPLWPHRHLGTLPSFPQRRSHSPAPDTGDTPGGGAAPPCTPTQQLS